jgi:hypothetical protein
MGIFNYFEPVGGVFAYEPAYNPSPWPPPGSDDPLREIAVRTLSVGTGMGTVLETIKEQCIEYRISGAVLAYLITCRPVYLPGLEIRRILQEKFGIPSVLIECDLVDERTFSEGQIKTRMDAFAEQILRRIEAGEPLPVGTEGV